MEKILSELGVRIIGSLIEKEITTPEYYPLTLNALTNACNQKNNRDPVVSYDETTVVRGLDELRDQGLVAMVTGAGMRVPKYREKFIEVNNFNQQHTALLCVLFLRGPQTLGELRSRSANMYNFSSLEEVETSMGELATKQPEPLVVKLPVQPGQKEARFVHLFSGTPSLTQLPSSQIMESARIQVVAENERIEALELQVKLLQEQVDQLKQQFADFHKQFE